MELDVVARVDVVGVAEMIRELLIGRQLIDVPNERVRAEHDLAGVAAVDHHTASRGIQRPKARSLVGIRLCDGPVRRLARGGDAGHVQEKEHGTRMQRT